MKQNFINFLICCLLLINFAACKNTKEKENSGTKEMQSQNSVKNDAIGKKLELVQKELGLYSSSGERFLDEEGRSTDYSIMLLSKSETDFFHPKNLRVFLVKGITSEDMTIVDELLFDKNTTDIFGTEPVIDNNMDMDAGSLNTRFVRYKMVNGNPVLINVYGYKNDKIIEIEPPKNLEIQFYEP